ncbi:MAG: hypothetical protein M0Z75_12095, partial [Nitrospiraceae bacterium]|nr:hypothetical protein [Nitrospiraceae bacterium]
MAEGKEAYCVVLRKQADFFPFQELAALLSEALGVPVPDAAAGLRRNWGLLFRTGEIGRGEALREKLAAAGVGVAVVAASRLRPLPPLKIIRKISLSGEGMVAWTGHGAADCAGQTEIPWRAFESTLLCAGSYTEEEATGEAEAAKSGPGLSDIVKAAAITIATGMPPLGK